MNQKLYLSLINFIRWLDGSFHPLYLRDANDCKTQFNYQKFKYKLTKFNQISGHCCGRIFRAFARGHCDGAKHVARRRWCNG